MNVIEMKEFLFNVFYFLKKVFQTKKPLLAILIELTLRLKYVIIYIYPVNDITEISLKMVLNTTNHNLQFINIVMIYLPHEQTVSAFRDLPKYYWL
jgi:hypothetical protein